MHWSCTREVACFLLSILLSSVVPADADEASRLSLREALARVSERNPDLKAATYELRALEARRTQTALPINPEVSLDIENVAGSGELRGTAAAEVTLALSQVIELGGKRRLRVASLTAEQSVAASEYEIRRVDTIAEALRKFVQVAQSQEHLAVAKRATDLTARTHTAVERRVRAARSPIAELHRVRVAAARAQLEQQHAEHALAAARRQLAALWGESEPSFAAVALDLYSLPAVGEFDQLSAQLGESPFAQRFLSEERLREAEIRLARAERSPNVTVGAGLRRLEESSDTAAVLRFSVPIPIRNRNQGAIREAEVRRERVGAERDARLVSARAELFAFYQELTHARTETNLLRREVLPEMEEALKQTEYAYERGRYSYLELVDAQRGLIEISGSLIEAATRYHLLLAEIEALTGEPLALPH